MSTNKDCCQFCLEGGDYEVRDCEKCPCHEWKVTCPKAGTTHFGCGICDPSTPTPSQKEENNGWAGDFDKAWETASHQEDIDHDNYRVIVDKSQIKSFVKELLHTEVNRVLEEVCDELIAANKGAADGQFEEGWDYGLKVATKIVKDRIQQQTVSAPTPPVSE